MIYNNLKLDFKQIFMNTKIDRENEFTAFKRIIRLGIQVFWYSKIYNYDAYSILSQILLTISDYF